MTEKKISLDSDSFLVREGETVLKAAYRQGINLSFSCGGGSCHVCLMKCVSGMPPVSATKGISAELVAAGYFLPCICQPEADMVITSPVPVDFQVDGLLVEWRGDALGGFLDIDLMHSLPKLEEGDHVALSVGGSRVDAVVVGLPEKNYYLGLRVASPETCGIDWPAHIGTSLVVHPVAADDIETAWAGDLHPAPDPDLWGELGAQRVRAVMESFYQRVFSDERLLPFFNGVTKERVTGKQYSFMEKLMTGKKVYFGDNPRNSHHWMVIPGELFDHREQLMIEALREHGVTETQIARWVALEAFYRRDIVKAKPFPRMIGGVPQPLDGFAEEVLDSGSVCDHCGQAVEAGERVIYHLRLGTIACKKCGTKNLAGS